jgi:hypothetical protein
MRPDEISLAVDWAAGEGWNPGLADEVCFASVDPEGFLIAELDGRPAAIVSCVNYDASFSFLGFYIVRADLRGKGYGLRIWNAAIAHAGPRVIGLDGVVAQQQNYRMSGFKLADANVRYGGMVAAPRRAASRRHCLVRRRSRQWRRMTRQVSGATIRVPACVDRCAVACRLRAGAGWPARRLGRDPAVPERFPRSARWWPTTAPPPKRCCRPCSPG